MSWGWCSKRRLNRGHALLYYWFKGSAWLSMYWNEIHSDNFLQVSLLCDSSICEPFWVILNPIVSRFGFGEMANDKQFLGQNLKVYLHGQNGWKRGQRSLLAQVSQSWHTPGPKSIYLTSERQYIIFQTKSDTFVLFSLPTG